jgi:hypothetical protein
MYFICPELHFALRAVGGDANEVAALLGPTSPQANAACPECHKPLKQGVFIDASLLARVTPVLREVTPLEAHLALEGLGFPDERDCAEEIVRGVLLGKSIRSVQAHGIRGTHRTVIDSITFEDGTTMFFSGSQWGALVYRLRKPNPFLSKESP